MPKRSLMFQPRRHLGQLQMFKIVKIDGLSLCIGQLFQRRAHVQQLFIALGFLTGRRRFRCYERLQPGGRRVDQLL
jgi:hypothetical protein